MAQDRQLGISDDDNPPLKLQRQNAVAYMPDFFAELRNYAAEVAQNNTSLNLEAELFFGDPQDPVLPLNVLRRGQLEDDETTDGTVELEPYW
jgi:hypothetical protein